MIVNSRFSGLVSIFPVIWNASVAKNKLHQLCETGFRANIISEDQHTPLAGLDADHGVAGFAIMPALVKTGPLRTIERHHAQARVKVLALFRGRQVRQEAGKLVGRGNVQAPAL